MKILQILATSNKPLSSREIEKGVVEGPKPYDRQVYRILENELCIQKFKYKFFLFDWNKLLSTIDEKLQVRKNIDLQRIVENFNTIGFELNESIVEFSKNEDGSLITIRNGSADPRLIKIQRESKDYATLTIFKNGKKVRIPTPLIVKEVHNKPHVFYEGFRGNPTQRGIVYLNTSLNEKASKISEAIKSRNPDLFNCNNEIKKNTITTKTELVDDTTIISAVSEIESDRRNWKYSLNTRGLILYILSMIKEENEGRARNVEISKVLQNLVENYKDEFPFLIYYKEITELYDKLSTEKEIPEYEYFQVKVIKQIALELQHNIDTINKKELDYHITKRYSDELTKRFTNSILPGSPFVGLVGIIPSIIRRYLVHNLVCLREYLKYELEKTEYDINNFYLKNDDTLSIS